MPTPINLNADMGESYGRFVVGDDAAILRLVQSASIACGLHGGDPSVMVTTIAAAKACGVSVGAHPGFNDLPGFGRRPIRMGTTELEHLMLYQIAAIDGVSRVLGHPISHVKPHGALNNMASEDPCYARAIARAVKAYNPALIFVATALGELVRAGERAGLTVAHEGFADRAYAADGRLMPRTAPDAMITDPERARDRVMAMVAQQAVFPVTGGRISTPIHTVCHHGDEPTAVPVARAVREALELSDAFELRPLPEMPLA